ncbi:muscle M-line assembly protein unc-89 [Artemisia annua]|uniref:Muscle M-line assembly protein unc-89 n=1 Tax=Artemisia annua TaxID=35608 RepID=A0A2U1Q312_ARTAN|nr:muscle M-line assembly protein unc-89 [Artemisia annua]
MPLPFQSLDIFHLDVLMDSPPILALVPGRQVCTTVQRTGREIVLTAFLQCKLCASKIREWLTGFHGVEGAEPDINYSQVAIKGSCCDTHELVEYIKHRTKIRALNENDIGGEVNEENPSAALKFEMVDGS